MIFWLLLITAIGAAESNGVLAPDVSRADPVAELRRILDLHPVRIAAGTGEQEPLDKWSFDVRKTDSLVNPILGLIFYRRGIVLNGEIVGSLQMKMTFHWNGSRWQFVQLMNADNGVDFGTEFLKSPEMRSFFEKAGLSVNGAL